MDNYSKIAFFASWNLEECNGKLHIANMHCVYMDYLCKKFDKVVLISPVKSVNSTSIPLTTDLYKNLSVVKLPYAPTMISAIKNYRYYYNAFKHLKGTVDVIYCRTPDPFSWMPRLFFGMNSIVDFVGDTIHCTWHNEAWGKFHKILMIGGYLPDYILTLIAARLSKTTTAGTLLSRRIRKFGVKSTPLIPSTIYKSDCAKELHPLQSSPVRFIYIGYLRFAKGMNCLMEFCKLLKQNKIDFDFKIIGDGEMMPTLQDFIKENDFNENIHLLGHLEEKEKMISFLRDSDIFFFPSLSEGAPRVVIEAMAQGIPVVSTPVGTLPYTFKDKENIRLFDFNNARQAINIIKDYIKDRSSFEKIRDKAYRETVNNYTIEAFLDQLFKK